MPCFTPLDAWRTTESTPNGRKISFERSENTTTKIQLPCGQCIGCKLDRSLVWAIRCVHEAQLHDQNSFITLTYSPQHVPWDGSLRKSDFQAFIKRLRYHFSERKINPETGRYKRYPTRAVRYYMCGEYGESLKRPHYHACLFGIDFPDKEPLSKKDDQILWRSATLETLWGKGHTSIGAVTFESAAYIARYITKKITGDQSHEHYETTCKHTGNLISLLPEYTCMSLKPGIAAEWFTKYKSEIYPSDFAIHRGRKIKLPRYYDKLAELSGIDVEIIKKKRKEFARLHRANNTPERLAVREKIQKRKYKQLIRSLENDT